MAQTVWILDANAVHSASLQRHLQEKMALETFHFSSGGEALHQLRDGGYYQPDVILLSLAQKEEAAQFMQILRRTHDIPIISLLNHGETDKAEEVLARGAVDFLLMPCHAFQLTAAIRSVLQRRRLQMEARRPGNSVMLENFKAQSPALQAALYMAQKVADSEASLLLQGAAGCGRELLARAIHNTSMRRNQPFIKLDASLQAKQEAESGLFGSAESLGKLAKVEGGTLFIRNIDAYPRAILDRLVRVAKHLAPISDARPNDYFQGRIVFAVDDIVKRSGSRWFDVAHIFSELNALTIAMPYLREMPEDIAGFVAFYCRRYAAIEGRVIEGISPDALQMLSEASWPGNLTQLSRAVFQAVICCEGAELQKEDFRYLLQQQGAAVPYLPGSGIWLKDETPRDGMLQCMDEKGNIKRLEDIEQELIRYALQRYSGHMSDVARHLGIGRSTLYRKLSNMVNYQHAG